MYIKHKAEPCRDDAQRAYKETRSVLRNGSESDYSDM